MVSQRYLLQNRALGFNCRASKLKLRSGGYMQDYSIDKSTWPDGPWKTEPDVKNWVDSETGKFCRILRQISGYLCGYVKILPESKLYELSSYEEHLIHFPELTIYSLNDLIEVHGGITFSGLDRLSENYMLGFDCGHVWDKYPDPLFIFNAENSKYRDIQYVTEQTIYLAMQLTNLENDNAYRRANRKS